MSCLRLRLDRLPDVEPTRAELEALEPVVPALYHEFDALLDAVDRDDGPRRWVA